MTKLYQFFFFNIILFIPIYSGYSSCKMPLEWIGSWYQHGMNSLLEITNDYIQTKGLCLDILPIQQYYLFIDQSNRCTRCLRFIQRHINLLQYRESECIDTDEQWNITSCPNMIAPDAVLYTLHRNDSQPELCPIHPPFLLTNLIKDNSVCHHSISSSYINECIDNYQFSIHLTPCLSYQTILDLQMTCVGTWIENYHTYFVTRIDSHSNQRQYACFRFLTKQNSSSSSFILNMATDDSCHDLYSQRISTVMTLASKNHYIINESCIFSNQYENYEWYSINQTIQMRIRQNKLELIGIDKHFSCQKMMHVDKFIRIYRVRTITNCDVKEECLRIIQRTKNVLEIDTVSLSKTNYCNNFHRKHHHFSLTFYTKSFILSHSCPYYIGNLIYQSNIDYYLKRKSFQMSIGCSNKQKLIISQKEKDIEQGTIVQTDTCIASWRSADLLTTYLIAQSKSSNSSYCLSFQMTNPIIIRNNSNDCSFHPKDNTKSISIYSANLIHPCSQSQRLSSNFFFTKQLFCFFFFFLLFI